MRQRALNTAFWVYIDLALYWRLPPSGATDLAREWVVVLGGGAHYRLKGLLDDLPASAGDPQLGGAHWTTFRLEL